MKTTQERVAEFVHTFRERDVIHGHDEMTQPYPDVREWLTQTFTDIEAECAKEKRELVREILKINIQSSIDFAMYQSKIHGYDNDERVKHSKTIQNNFTEHVQAIAEKHNIQL